MRSDSFMACRRSATRLLTKWETGGSELRPINHLDLDMTLAIDQVCEDKLKNSEAALSPSKDKKMTFPEWTKPGIYGAIAGAIAATILGFSWGGWTTSSSAQEMAQNLATDQVAMAMVPVCLNMSAADPQRAEKIAVIQGASGYSRSRELMKTGWATLPGEDKPSRDLADACIEGLELDGS